MTSNTSYSEAQDLWRCLLGSDEGLVKLLRRDSSGVVRSATFERVPAKTLVTSMQAWAKDSIEAFRVVADTDGNGVAACNVIGARAVAVDVDRVDFDPQWMALHPLRPSIAIQTSLNRYHFIWLLKELCSKAKFLEAAKILAMRIGGDLCFANPVQAVRIPGLMHQTKEQMVRLLGTPREDLRYDVDKLILAFDGPVISRHLSRSLPKLTSGLQLPKDSTPIEDLLADARDALNFISPDSYDNWYRCGLALKPLGDAGYRLWHEWSARSKKFSDEECKSKWTRLGSPREIKPSTILFMAANQGWVNPGYRSIRRSRAATDERALARLVGRSLAEQCVGIAANGKAKSEFILCRWVGTQLESLKPHEARQLVEATCDKMVEENLLDSTEAKALCALTSKTSTLNTLVEGAAEYLHVPESQFVCDHFPYLPVANGVLNLLSGDLVPANYRPLSTKRANVTFDPSATAPLFTQVMTRLHGGDEEKVRFIERVLAYALLGKPVEHVVPIFIGSGRNGKSMTLELMQEIFGEFACSMSPAAILAKSHNNDTATPMIARTIGRRLVVVTEPSPKHPIDAALIKQIAGGDRMQARALHGPLVEFKPEFVLMLALNRLPSMPVDDKAFWKRLLLIHWPVEIPDDEADRELVDRLLREAPGILNILLKALRSYLVNGLKPPAAIAASAAAVRQDMDVVSQWLEECAATDVSTARTKLADLYVSFVSFAEASKTTLLTKQEFGRRLEGQGFKKTVARNYPCFLGIKIKEEAS